MRTAGTASHADFSSDNVELGETYSSRFSGQIGVILGLAVLIAVAIAFASLATWSVDDPSLSSANGREVQNAGGAWGAVFADLALQFFGLAALVLIVPPAVWGWLKLIQKPIGAFRRRAAAWPAAVLASTAALACLQRPESWPLPSGLGGLAGDIILKLPAMMFGGYPSGITAAMLFVVLTVPATMLALYASGLLMRNNRNKSLTVDSETGEVFEEEETSGWLLGALAHFWLVARSVLQRRRKHSRIPSSHHPHDQGSDEIPEQPSAHSQTGRTPGIAGRIGAMWTKLTAPPDDGLEEFHQDIRSEPEFSSGTDIPGAQDDPSFITAPRTAPGYGETVYNPNTEDGGAADQWAEQTPPVSDPAQPSGRVSDPAPKPAQGTRVIREAQQSLKLTESFELPQLSFLGEAKNLVQDASLSAEALEANARLLEGVLEDFGVKGEIINVRPGPVVTLYELEPAPGIKSSRVIGLADDIARSMSAIACRVAVVPGRNAIGIELPNQRRETVYLRETLTAKDYEQTKQKLALVLGKTIGGEPVIADLAKMPHLLVAGTTGSGKSVAINTMILSILYRLTPEQVKLIMIDPKMLELSIYDGIPHLLTPVVTDPKKAVVALKWTVREMEERYKKMSKLGVRNIDGFNQRLEQARKKGETLTRTVQTGYDRESGEAIFETEELDLQPMPYIVVIIDEMADLMMVAGKDIEGAIQRLAQMARAAGIHVIMATQRPSVDVITGTIKANFPTRISFQVTSKIDSRTILGEQGAEQLLGMGDMLYMAGGGRIQRVHGPFVADDEVEKVVSHLKTQGVPQYLDAVTEEEEEGEASAAGGEGDPLAASNDIYDQAVAVVLRDRKVSTSYIQRRLGIGYNRAASLIERMEQEGLIGPANHAGKREILVPGEDETI
ncbi:DNA translocase FtsK [Salaquimonas pukyongi]|uniref:DNA translocase FtsK n=1 Tax=Salaquimonas pukyongi TaxID=2712698 RepID=UPI00096B838A|nr:DNA translocase FtsK [Salaquimonas pukyongi]